MSQAASRLSLVAATLPTVDRRSLSQAWYSALHLAPRSHGVGSHLVQPAPRSHSRAGSPSPAPHRTLDMLGAPPARPARAPALRRGIVVAYERRSPPIPLARKVVEALERRRPAETPATVVVRTECGRVHVVIRRSAQAVRLFAICTPTLRETVERALAQARYALAGQGARVC